MNSSSMYGRVLYVLPNPVFFTELKGIGGHVAHVKGVVDALLNSKYRVSVLAHGTGSLSQRPFLESFELPSTNSDYVHRQLWNIKLLRRANHILTLKPFSFSYTRYARQFAPWLPVLKRSLQDKPLVVEVNSFASQEHPWLAPIDAWALRSADVIVVVSSVLQSLLYGRLGTLVGMKSVIIPNGVDIARFDRAEGIKLSPEDAMHVGYVGVLKENYGLEELLECARLLRLKKIRTVLHIAGAGPFQERLCKEIRDKTDICFHGAIDFDMVPKFLKSLDVLLYSSSRKNEFQSPIKLYEYMAAGRAIVAMRTPATESVIEDGLSGILVPLGSAKAMAEAIEHVSLRSDRGRSLGVAARAAAENHSWKSRIQTLLTALKERGSQI